MGYIIGIDIGGTFTDGIVMNGGGEIRLFKTPTTFPSPTAGFFDLLRLAAEAHGEDLNSFLRKSDKLTYGTTLATNLLIEKKTAKVGLITTRGFKDTLTIARVGRDYLSPDLFECERPPELVPRELIWELTERIDCQGDVLIQPEETEMEAILADMRQKEAEALAVCLLWSFKNPIHEQWVADRLAKSASSVYLSLSSELAPIMGEYERTVTASINAALGPRIRDHLSELDGELTLHESGVPLMLMQSTGGVLPVDEALARPVQLINSGPAGGVLAAEYFSQLTGYDNSLCIDMGGTSFDVSLITKRRHSINLESLTFGHVLYVPMIKIHSIGAGGGSIAWLDAGKRVKVGPRSAGAFPGPACYGRGGNEPTVTDADLLLGYLNPQYFLGGRMRLEVERARKAIEGTLGKPLARETVEIAAGIIKIVEANMAGAIRLVTLEEGYDPRDYALLAFGGASPLHACALALEMEIETVVVPTYAPALSAFGVANSDIVHSFSLTDVMDPNEPARAQNHYFQMERRGQELLDREGIPPAQREIRRWAELRYKGQIHTVLVEVPLASIDGNALEGTVRSFEEKYQEIYGRGAAYRKSGCEIVNLGVEVRGKIHKLPLKNFPPAGRPVESTIKSYRSSYFGGDFASLPIYDGNKLSPNDCFEGPAIVEYVGTTVRILEGFKARVDPYLTLILTR